MRLFKKPYKLCDFYMTAKILWLYYGMTLSLLVAMVYGV